MKLETSNLDSGPDSRGLNADTACQDILGSPHSDHRRVSSPEEILASSRLCPASEAGAPIGPVRSVASAESGSTTSPPLPDPPFSAFGSISQFKDAQRMATLLTHCSVVPENYRGEEHLGDCVIALEIANRLGVSILAVMQNLRFVEGKLGWSAQFLISCVNASGQFSPIRYQMTGTRGEDSRGCVAWAVDQNGELLKSPEVTIKMAKEEGWYYRAGSKWATMPELMLCYHSATLFTRLYAPEITMGIQTAEEVVEMGAEGNGQHSRPVFEASSPKTKAERPAPVQSAAVSFLEQPAVAKKEEGRGPSGSEPAAGQASVPPSPTGQRSKPQSAQYNYLKALRGLLSLSKHSEEQVVSFLYQSHRCAGPPTSLARIA